MQPGAQCLCHALVPPSTAGGERGTGLLLALHAGVRGLQAWLLDLEQKRLKNQKRPWAQTSARHVTGYGDAVARPPFLFCA